MKRTAIYMRVSSDRQAKEGDSIPAQREALTKYVSEKPDLVLSGEYLDDGVSGRYAQRDELQRLLDDVQDGCIDLIIFTKLDRWFRSVRHYTATQEILDKHNVGWIAIWEPIYDTTTPAGRLIVNQMMSIAQFEAENTGQRIRQVFDYKVSKGEAISGNLPLGYSIIDKHLQPDQNADIVRDLFNYYNMVGSLADLTRYAIERYGLRREPSTWRRFLKNRKYIGEFRNNANYCPAIISDELFDDVQRRLSKNLKDNDRKNVYIFSGLIVCYGCGCKLTGSPISYRRKGGALHKYKGYRCHRKYSPAGICDGTRRRFEITLEKYLVNNISSLALRYIAEIQGEAQTEDIPAKVSAIEKKSSRLKELYINGLISIEEYTQDKIAFDRELESLKKRKKQDVSKFGVVCDSGFAEMYWSFTDEEKQFLWHSIIEEIHWSKDGQISVKFLS